MADPAKEGSNVGKQQQKKKDKLTSAVIMLVLLLFIISLIFPIVFISEVILSVVGLIVEIFVGSDDNCFLTTVGPNDKAPAEQVVKSVVVPANYIHTDTVKDSQGNVTNYIQYGAFVDTGIDIDTTNNLNDNITVTVSGTASFCKTSGVEIPTSNYNKLKEQGSIVGSNWVNGATSDNVPPMVNRGDLYVLNAGNPPINIPLNNNGTPTRVVLNFGQVNEGYGYANQIQVTTKGNNGSVVNTYTNGAYLKFAWSNGAVTFVPSSVQNIQSGQVYTQPSYQLTTPTNGSSISLSWDTSSISNLESISGTYAVYVQIYPCVTSDGFPAKKGNIGKLQYAFTDKSSSTSLNDISYYTPASSPNEANIYYPTSSPYANATNLIDVTNESGGDGGGSDPGTATISPPSNTKSRLWLRVYDQADNYVNDRGNYQVAVHYKSALATPGDFFTKILNAIDKPLATVRNAMMESYSNDSTFGGWVRVFITIAIICYAGMYVIGILQLGQYEFISRIVKISLVLAITSPDAANFFNSHVLDIFYQGTNYLISSFNPPGTPVDNPFAFIEYYLRNLVTWPNFLRVMSLLFFNWSGIITLIIIIYALVCYVKALFTVLASYLIAKVIITYLAVISPIFLCLSLFEFTSYMFKTWVKLMLRYVLEPAIMLLFLNICSDLIFVLLYSFFTYPICYKCAIPLFNTAFLAAMALPDFLKNMFNNLDYLLCIKAYVPYGQDSITPTPGSNEALALVLLVKGVCVMFVCHVIKSIGSVVPDLVSGMTHWNRYAPEISGDSVSGISGTLTGLASTAANRGVQLGAKLAGKAHGKLTAARKGPNVDISASSNAAANNRGGGKTGGNGTGPNTNGTGRNARGGGGDLDGNGKVGKPDGNGKVGKPGGDGKVGKPGGDGKVGKPGGKDELGKTGPTENDKIDPNNNNGKGDASRPIIDPNKNLDKSKKDGDPSKPDKDPNTKDPKGKDDLDKGKGKDDPDGKDDLNKGNNQDEASRPGIDPNKNLEQEGKHKDELDDKQRDHDSNSNQLEDATKKPEGNTNLDKDETHPVSDLPPNSELESGVQDDKRPTAEEMLDGGKIERNTDFDSSIFDLPDNQYGELEISRDDSNNNQFGSSNDATSPNVLGPDDSNAFSSDGRNSDDIASSSLYTTLETKDIASSSLYTTPDTKDSASSSLYTTPDTKDSTSSSLYTTPDTKDSASSSLYTTPDTKDSASSSLYTTPETNGSASLNVEHESQKQNLFSHNKDTKQTLNKENSSSGQGLFSGLGKTIKGSKFGKWISGFQGILNRRNDDN